MGAPQLERATLHLPGGKKLTIIADNLSEDNYVVDKVFLNGKFLKRIFVTHTELMEGGVLSFKMKKGKVKISNSLFKVQ